MCLVVWVVRLEELKNVASQYLHLYGFSPVCRRLCSFRVPKIDPQRKKVVTHHVTIQNFLRVLYAQRGPKVYASVTVILTEIINPLNPRGD